MIETAMKWLLLATMLVGCSMPYHSCLEGKARQCEATDLVWKSFLGNDDVDPPSVEWYYGECGGQPGLMYDGHCVWGVFHSDGFRTIITDTDERFSKTVFAHELLHAHFYLHYGDCDHDHTRPEWRTLLSQINAELHNEGM